MSATADLIIERRRVRRRLALWRIVAIVAIVVAVVAWLPQAYGTATRDHVARLRLDGVILDDPERESMLLELSENDHVKAVIFHINSPGGTVAASEALYENLRRIAKDRPVVAVMSEAAASGGYIAALSADHIIARGGTLTGSIGVVTQIPNLAGLMEMLGVGVTRVKSAPLKAEPSLIEPPGEAALEVQRTLIADSYAWFKNLVGERRGLDAAALETVADGRVFTGRQALANGLIDALGGEEVARDWLLSRHGIDAELPAVDYDWTESPLPWPASLFRDSMAAWLPPSPVLPAGPRLYAVIQ
jgi:protease-4